MSKQSFLDRSSVTVQDANRLMDWQHVDWKRLKRSTVNRWIRQGAFDSAGIVRDCPDQGAAAMTAALQIGHPMMLRRLLEAGAPTGANAYGWPLLVMAAQARKGGNAMVGLLLEAGCDPNAATTDGCTPLWAAVEWGSTPVETIALLCDGGARVDARRSVPISPSSQALNALARAVERNNAMAVEAMVRHGADPHAMGAVDEFGAAVSIHALAHEIINTGSFGTEFLEGALRCLAIETKAQLEATTEPPCAEAKPGIRL